MENNRQNVTKDDEFKISLSMEDIDKIDEEVKNMERDSKKILDESVMIEKIVTSNVQKNHNVVDGVSLFNMCVTCHNRFKPVNSMTYETSCDACSEKKQIS